MKKIFCYVVAVATLTGTANADLYISKTSALGSKCYSESDSDWYLIECGPASESDVASRVIACPETYSDIQDMEYQEFICTMGAVGNKLRACAMLTDSDSEEVAIICEELFNGWTNWSYIGNYRVSRNYVNSAASKTSSWSATVSIEKETEYGCADGYYQSAGSGATMTCSPCPKFGEIAGKSEIGNTAITGCYVPVGAIFCDETGDYKCQANAYWKN